MNILDTYQEDVFSCFDLPILSKCKSIELDFPDPPQIKRAYSDYTTKAELLQFNPNQILCQNDYEFFPQIDFSQIFAAEEPQIVIPVPEQAQEPEKNEPVEEDVFNQFAMMFEVFAEDVVADPEERDFLFGFDFDVEAEVRVPQAERAERPQRAQRGQRRGERGQRRGERGQRRGERGQRAGRPQRVENAALAGEAVDYFLEELFLDCSVKLPAELVEEMKQFAFFEMTEFAPTFIRCKICLTLTEDYHEIDCKHRYCVSCYKMFCQSLLDACKIMPEDINCPECEVKITDFHFLRYLSHEDTLRIADLRFKIRGQLLVAQKKAVSCPVPDCPGYAHLLKDEKITACCKCRCTLCCFCGLSVHPNITCEENMKIGQDETLEKLLLSQNWKRCPTCGVPVEKIDGCQFLYCDSVICKGRNNLCYICGRFVIEAQHFSHYKTKGPFGDTCNTLDGLPEDVDLSTVVPQFGNEDQGDGARNWGGEEE